MASGPVRVIVTGKDELSDVLLKVGRNTQQFAGNASSGFAAVGSGAVSGLGKASNALTNLAGNLLGVNTGVGNLVEGLGSFFAGSAVVTAVAAGITIVVGLMAKFSEGAREAKKDYDAYMQSLRGSETPLARVGKYLDVLKAQLAETQKMRPWDWKGATELKTQIAELQKQYDGLFASLHKEATAKTGAKALKDVADHTKAAADQTKRLNDELDKAAQRLLEQNLARQREQRIAAAGGGNVILPPGEAAPAGGVPGILQGGRTFGEGSRIGEVGQEVEAAAAPLEQFNATVMETDSLLNEMGGSTLVALTGAFATLFEGLGQGQASFSSFSKAALKGIAVEASGRGRYFILDGLARAAQSLFPPNPPAIAAGLAEAGKGALLTGLAGTLGGSGAGGVASGGGGGVSPSNFERNQEQAAASRGTLTVDLRGRGMVDPQDPRFVDFIAETIRAAQGRHVTILR